MLVTALVLTLFGTAPARDVPLARLSHAQLLEQLHRAEQSRPSGAWLVVPDLLILGGPIVGLVVAGNFGMSCFLRDCTPFQRQEANQFAIGGLVGGVAALVVGIVLLIVVVKLREPAGDRVTELEEELQRRDANAPSAQRVPTLPAVPFDLRWTVARF